MRKMSLISVPLAALDSGITRSARCRPCRPLCWSPTRTKKKPFGLPRALPRVCTREPEFPLASNLNTNHSVIAELENKQTTLIDVVQSLGEYINDEDAILRGKAVSYLTAVIKALPPKFLSRQQIQVLTTFFCDRIEDGGAIAGLDTLQGLERFHSDMAKDIARA